MDYRELANNVRAKYPGKYDDMDDMALSKAVVGKFPQYADTAFDEPLTDSPEPSLAGQAASAIQPEVMAPPQEEPSDSFLSKGWIGELIGKSAAGSFGPVGQFLFGKLGRRIAEKPKETAEMAVEALPGIGSIALPAGVAAVTGGIGTPAAVGLSGAGMAGGEFLRQRGREALGLEAAPPLPIPFSSRTVPRLPGVSPEVSNIIQQGAGGALMEAAPRAVFSGIARGRKGFASFFKPKLSQEVMEYAEKSKVPLTPAEMTQGKQLSQLETTFENFPVTSGTAQSFKELQAQTLTAEGSALRERMGTSQSPYSIGKDIQEGIKTKADARFKVAQKLYERLDGMVPEEAEVPLSNVNELAIKLLQKEYQLPRESQNMKVVKTLEAFAKEPGAPFSWQGVRALRARWNEMIGDQGRGLMGNTETAMFRQLKSALDSDIQEFASGSGGQIKKAYDVANAFYGSQKSLFKSNKNIQAILRRNPEDVVDFVLSPKNISEIDDLHKAVPGKDYELFEKGVVNRLFQPRGINQTPEQALTGNIARYGKATIEKALGKDKLRHLEKLSELTTLTGFAARTAGNPSGTARNIIGFSNLMYFIRHPIKGTILSVPAYVMAKAYYSPFTRSLITRGLTTPMGSEGSTAIYKALYSNFSKRMEDEKDNGKKNP